MSDPAFDRNATDPAVPTRRRQGQRAQERSSKAEGLRVGGACLTEPSTMAFCFQSEARSEPPLQPLPCVQSIGGRTCCGRAGRLDRIREEQASDRWPVEGFTTTLPGIKQ